MTNNFKNQAAEFAARHRALLSAILYIGWSKTGKLDWRERREVEDWMLCCLNIDTLSAQIEARNAEDTVAAFVAAVKKSETAQNPAPEKPESVKQAEKLLADREQQIKKHYPALKDILNRLPVATTLAEFEALLHQAKAQSPNLLEEALAVSGSVAIATIGDIFPARSAIGKMKDVWGGWVTLSDGRRF